MSQFKTKIRTSNPQIHRIDLQVALSKTEALLATAGVHAVSFDKFLSKLFGGKIKVVRAGGQDPDQFIAVVKKGRARASGKGVDFGPQIKIQRVVLKDFSPVFFKRKAQRIRETPHGVFGFHQGRPPQGHRLALGDLTIELQDGKVFHRELAAFQDSLARIDVTGFKDPRLRSFFGAGKSQGGLLAALFIRHAMACREDAPGADQNAGAISERVLVQKSLVLTEGKMNTKGIGRDPKAAVPLGLKAFNMKEQGRGLRRGRQRFGI